MSVRAFRALMGKDLRLFRGPIRALFWTGFGGYALMAIARLAAFGWSAESLYGFLGGGSVLATGLTTVVATTFGGMAFATERRDRTAEFLDCLPPGRLVSAASKLLVAGSLLMGVIALYVGVPAGVLWASNSFDLDLPGESLFALSMAVYYGAQFVAGMVMGFGIAWLCSSVSRSAAISAAIGAGCALVTYIAVDSLRDPRRWHDGQVLAWWTAIALASGVLSVVAGTAVHLRRVQP